MSHPIINNETSMMLNPIFVTDEDGRVVCATLVRGTFRLSENDPNLLLHEKQIESVPAGELFFDAPISSYKYEPEVAFVKPFSDVVLIGHAQSVQPQQSIDVGLRVGALQKVVRVFGDRYWVKQDNRIFMTRPQQFTRLPLVYERAFGGWDRAGKDESGWRYEPRNPVGTGFGDPLRFVEEGKVLMPNIEDPQHLIRNYGDRPPPAGFGFVSPNWQSRAAYAGTYDEQWDKSRKPLLPEDFDRRFFNGASPGLITPAYLRGDEDVVVMNASPVPKLKFKLPGIPPPVCKLVLRGGRTETLETNLDTVIINTDEMLVFLLWRSYVRVPSGPNDVASIDVTIERTGGVAAMAY